MCGTRVSKLYIFCRSRVKEYLPIIGLADFNKLSAKLILGADRWISWFISSPKYNFIFCCWHIKINKIYIRPKAIHEITKGSYIWGICSLCDRRTSKAFIRTCFIENLHISPVPCFMYCLAEDIIQIHPSFAPFRLRG